MSGNVVALREYERVAIVLPALCRSRTGFRDHVMVYDLSMGGCMIESHALTLNEGDLVVIRPEGLEGLAGRVRWTDGHRAGIRFEQLLYGPVVDHLHRTYSSYLQSLAPQPQSDLRLVA